MNPHDLKYRKYGVERTPGGQIRHQFMYGVHETSICLFKYNRHKTIVDAPECFLMSFDVVNFVRSARAVGLHLTRKEVEQLKSDFKIGES